MVNHGFLFSLPHSFFAAAECVASSQKSENEALTATLGVEGSTPRDDPAAVAVKQRTVWEESGATCITCGIGVNSQGFHSSAEQRQHFKTDWHRYNLKRRLDKKPAVSEQEFERMIEAGDDVSSISGSDTDSSDEDDKEVDSDDGDDHQTTARRASHAQASIQGAQAVFRTADGVGFAVWRCLLLPDSHKHKQQQDQSPEQLLRLLQQLRRSPDSNSNTAAAAGTAVGSHTQQPDTSGCLWALLMLRGGHFAAAVVRINSSSSSSQQAAAAPAVPSGAGSTTQQQQQQRPRSQQVASAAEPFTVLAHKTFHRYVVRAKAGGKQSTKDATGKYARSAGSRLRRYNEAALQRDVTQLIKDWAPYLRAAQLIFIAAPGSNSQVVFTAAADVGPLAAAVGQQHQQQQAAAVLDPGDPRIRRVPFVTQRPTFSELKRVLLVLGSVRQVALPTDAELAAAAAAAENSKSQQQQQQGEREIVQAAVDVRSVGPAGVIKKQEEAALIKASKSGDAERVSRLLTNGHDPTVRDSKGRTPYQLAANKEVRDAFRRFMAAQPDAWDYSGTDIPSPLTEEMETAQQSKKAEKRARQKAKEKERKDSRSTNGSSAAAAAVGGESFDDELAAAMAEAAAISSRAAASGKGKQVGAGTSSSSSKGKGKSAPAAAPDPAEMARRREQLAAAAEARLKALQQKQQLW